MSKKTTLILVLIVLLASSIIAPSPVKAASKTIIVPNDYPTIQAAIDNAGESDTVFVKKGTYKEQVLEINKPIRLLGEKIDETIVNLNPPLVNYTLIYLTMQVYDTAITIDANDVKLAGFTINMPTDRMNLGGINARGDKIEIVNNKLGRECSIELNGNLANISGNSISAGVAVIGDNQTISNNLLAEALDSQGKFSRVTGNTICDINLRNSSYNLILNNSFTRMIMEYCDINFTQTTP